MENNCNYSDEWQPYLKDYDKFEYDIRLKDGTIIENCYPNGGKFNSISDLHDGKSFDENDVSEIRFSENPRYGINSRVSKRSQYEYLDNRNPPFIIYNNPYSFIELDQGKKFVCKGKHQYILNNESGNWICQCGRNVND